MFREEEGGWSLLPDTAGGSPVLPRIVGRRADRECLHANQEWGKRGEVSGNLPGPSDIQGRGGPTFCGSPVQRMPPELRKMKSAWLEHAREGLGITSGSLANSL